MIYDSVLDTIGNTPLIRASRLAAEYGVKADLLVKQEGRNPGGSAKDRVGIQLIRDAENSGRLKPGGTIIEATSGNTGIGLGLAACVLGYRVILTMPDTMSVERQKILRAFGAELILTDGKKGMAGANEKAKELCKKIPNSIRAFQFENPANPAAHVLTTGPELWRDTEGRISAYVASVGTGGTLCGAGKYLKSMNPAIRVIAVEPSESPLLSGGKAGSHGIQGIGANFIPANYDPSVVDEVITVTTGDSIETSRRLMATEGLLCGISSGAAVRAALMVGARTEFAGKIVAAILPDTGERYLSTDLFAEENPVNCDND
jgi:cysteine synthase A